MEPDLPSHKYRHKPPVFKPLHLPDIPLNLILIGRSNTHMDSWLADQRENGSISMAKVKKMFYPEDLMDWRDRSNICHVIILEHPSDPIYYREQVGRVKIYFHFLEIVQVIT